MSRRRSKTRGHASREERRKEASARLEVWGMLSPDMKIASLRGRRGESKRQIDRIISQRRSS